MAIGDVVKSKAEAFVGRDPFYGEETIFEKVHDKTAGGNKYITIPKQGGLQTLPEGNSLIDLELGTLTLPSGSPSEIGIGKIEPTKVKKGPHVVASTIKPTYIYRALSFFIYADKDIIIFLNEAGGGGMSFSANSNSNIRGIPIEKMIIRTTTSTKIKAMFSVFPDAILNFDEVVPSTEYNGVLSITATAAQVSSTSTPIKSITIVAEDTNVQNMYVGDSSVSTSNGFELTPGSMHSWDIKNLNLLYVIGTASDSARYTAVL